MADLSPPNGEIPAWLLAALGAISAVAGWKGLGPLARWTGARIEAWQQAKAIERGDTLARLTAELKAEREENVALRHELMEEREIRATYMADHARLNERIDQLHERMAADKRECAGAIRRLRAELAELKSAHRGGTS